MAGAMYNKTLRSFFLVVGFVVGDGVYTEDDNADHEEDNV